jgi:hypothetical protein
VLVEPPIEEQNESKYLGAILANRKGMGGDAPVRIQ